jgi:esterase
MSPRDGFVSANGLRFHYQEHGDPAAPPVLIVPGVLNTARSWVAVGAALAARWRVIVLDMRGHGESDHANDYSWPRWIEDLEGCWSALGLTRGSLVGHSLGGRVVVQFAANNPDKTDRIILVDAVAGAAWKPESAALFEHFFQLHVPEGYESLEAWVDLASTLFPRARRDLLEATTAEFSQFPDGRWRWTRDCDPRALDNAMPPELEREAIENVVCPVLCIRAAHSEIWPLDEEGDTPYFKDRSTAVLLASGHGVQSENPDGLAQLVDDFLSTA